MWCVGYLARRFFSRSFSFTHIYVTPAKNGNYYFKCKQTNTIHFDLKYTFTEKQTHKSRMRFFLSTLTLSVHLCESSTDRFVCSQLFLWRILLLFLTVGILAKTFSFLLARNLFVCSLFFSVFIWWMYCDAITRLSPAERLTILTHIQTFILNYEKNFEYFTDIKCRLRADWMVYVNWPCAPHKL